LLGDVWSFSAVAKWYPELAASRGRHPPGIERGAMEKLSVRGGPLPQPAGSESVTVSAPFRISDYRIDPDLDRIAGPVGESRVEPKAMAVLVHLARRQGAVVSADELVNVIWLGRPMGDNPVYRCIAQLRRAFGDDSQSPSYIATVPKKGYRLIPPVEELAPEFFPRAPAKAAETAPALAGWRGNAFRLAMLAGLAALAVLLWVVRDEVASPPGTGPATLAVLPFANLSPDPEHEQFADGISEEILNRLSAYAELQVIARTSSFVFKDSGYDVRRICDLLGVEHLLQGSVRRDNGHVRISATLVDRNGFQLWQTTLERELGGIFALKDEIAEAVATSIVPQIAPLPAPVRLPDLEAYEHYLIGREILIRRLPEFAHRSAGHFTSAIAHDPEFAEPYAERAIALTLGAPAVADYEQAHEQAQRDIDTALALNPDSARAYAAQSLLVWTREPDAHDRREALARRALAIDPNMIDALNWLAIVLQHQGRYAESEETYRKAIRVDPFAPTINVNLAWIDAHRGNFAEAEQRLLRQLEIPQATNLNYQILLRLYRSTGRLVEQVEIAKKAIFATIEDDASGWHLDLAAAYAALGMWERAEYWQARAERMWPDEHFVRLSRVRIEIAAGRLEVSQAPSRFRETLDEAGLEIGRISRRLTHAYGELQALAGEYEGAIATLEPLINPVAGNFSLSIGSAESNTLHALAWTWMQAGAHEKAGALLRPADERFRLSQAEGRLRHFSEGLAYFARNTLLLGDVELALELLDQAVEAGWREYYMKIRDPRWALVDDEPRFKSNMARVKADIEQQRARMEQVDAEDNFTARLDAALVAREARVAIP
jgi:TolB-like protein/DNA-binding winged helix-turn-helix (wHTH) protein/tetratricopeptide (TPR) repeat protein